MRLCQFQYIQYIIYNGEQARSNPINAMINGINDSNLRSEMQRVIGAMTI